MSLEPKSPGSFSDYVAERTHPAVLVDELTLKWDYDDELSRYRKGLAERKGVTPEELHTGIGGLAIRRSLEDGPTTTPEY